MTRYAEMFERLGLRRERAFGAFLMLGDPDREASAALLDALVEGGADLIEVGIPFSDPIADGPVIQAASVRALRAGAKVDTCLELLEHFRARHPDVPVGILTYANLLAARGRSRFCSDTAAAGVDSLLVADVPALEAAPYVGNIREAGIDAVMIAAPNTPRQTLARIADLCSGYTYCVTRMGVTGTHDELALSHGELFAELNRLNAPPPVFGFGISTPGHVREAIAAGAAGVISGSAIVRIAVESDYCPSAVASFVATMKEATRPQSGKDFNPRIGAENHTVGAQRC